MSSKTLRSHGWRSGAYRDVFTACFGRHNPAVCGRRTAAERTRMYSQRVLESHPAGCAGDDLLSHYSGNESMGRMQKELHTGIDLAVALIKQDTLPALLNTATSQLQKAFGLTDRKSVV